VHFKHQYITNPTISPESLVVTAAQQLTTALKGNIPAGNETAEALTRVSELFTKIATAKNEIAKAKEQRNKLRTNLAARKCTPPRVVAEPSRVETPAPRVTTQRKPGPNRKDHPGPNYISQDKEDDDKTPPQRCTTRATAGNIL
jgi:hypothetical protein